MTGDHEGCEDGIREQWTVLFIVGACGCSISTYIQLSKWVGISASPKVNLQSNMMDLRCHKTRMGL